MVDKLNDDIGEEKRLQLWEMMLKLRLVEKKAYDLFLQNLIKGTSHLALGQEAIAGAFGVALKQGDYTFCTYRGHAHTLARGSSIEGVLGELMGRQCGLMKGKGGSMHLTDVDKGVMGSYAIIGAHLTIANGTALASKYNKTNSYDAISIKYGLINLPRFYVDFQDYFNIYSNTPNFKGSLSLTYFDSFIKGLTTVFTVKGTST